MRHTRRAVLATAAATATAGCLGSVRRFTGPAVDVDGASVVWRATVPEPVADVAATPDRVYVSSAAPGPSDVLTPGDLVPSAYAGRVDAFTPDGTRAWRTTLSTRARQVVPVPGAGVRVATGRTTMTGPRERQVRALSRDGAERWATSARDAAVSIAGVVDDRTVVATAERPRSAGEGALAVLGPDGGREWRKTPGAVADASVVGDAVVSDVASGRAGAVTDVVAGYALATGGRRWYRKAGRWAAAGDSIYLHDSELAAVSLFSGATRWTAPLPETFAGDDRTLAASPRVVVTGRDAAMAGWTLVGRDPDDGTRRWSAGSDTGGVIGLAAIDDTVVRLDDRARGRSAADGTERWRVDVAGDATILLHADDRRLVVIGGTDDRSELVSVAPQTGDVRWRATGIHAPLAATDDRVYATAPGGVVALTPA